LRRGLSGAAEKMNKVLAGLTGLSCAGKNYAGALLEKKGFAVLDLDRTAHSVLDENEVKTFVIRRWGEDMADSEGKIRRPLLGERVFGKPEELKALESIVHPAVDRRLEAWIAESRCPVCIANGAVIHKSAFFKQFDYLIVVRASFLTRFIRAKTRDKQKTLGILRRFKSQADFSRFYSQYFMGKADNPIINIYNEGAVFFSRLFRKKFEKQIDSLVKVLEKAALEKN